MGDIGREYVRMMGKPWKLLTVFSVQCLGCRDVTPIMENHMEKRMEYEMDVVVIKRSERSCACSKPARSSELSQQMQDTQPKAAVRKLKEGEAAPCLDCMVDGANPIVAWSAILTSWAVREQCRCLRF